MRLVKAQFSHTWGYRWRAGTAPSVCTKGNCGGACREAELKYMGSHFWASSAFSPSRFLAKNYGAQKPKRKYVLCSGSAFSPGFLIKDDFIVWLPIKVFVFLSSLSLGSVTMDHSSYSCASLLLSF